MDDNDPIKASYDVFVKPRISGERRVYILQFPNRDARQNYNASSGAQPLKMRIKPKAGMVEIDVPIQPFDDYDREKGIKWGHSMKKSQISKGGGSHGLPGGFGIGGAPPSTKGKGKEKNTENEVFNQEEILEDFEAAVKKELVLLKQTLGGQSILKSDTTPQYMIGTFRKDQLHLTPVDEIVQMRPQFHHIDATTEQERLSRVRETAAPKSSEVRAVQMSVKSHTDYEKRDGEISIAERIAAVQSEAWKLHQYIDEDTDEAWGEYSESMFVCPNHENTLDILTNLPELKSAYLDPEYLDAISSVKR
ncbi:hypothetical protein K3495_g15173 [Podosphaera aphanis]|nr:hypothetical protein K3495_g15173 [Podosphaera aphanis]